MKNKVIIVGLGEIGGVFARGFLKEGYPVYPVNRNMDISAVAKDVPDPELVVVTVGEKDLQVVLKTLPDVWHDRVVLVQNELLPDDWQKHNMPNPTVISIWFEKKQPRDYKVIIPSPVYGPHAKTVAEALQAINISCRILKREDELVFELVLKNLYILTTNISGLEVGGNVGELWNQNQDLARAVANDVLDIQFSLIGKDLDREALIEKMVEAFEGDLEHKCMGRSAPARLERAVAQADAADLEIPKLRQIQSHQKKTSVSA